MTNFLKILTLTFISATIILSAGCAGTKKGGGAKGDNLARLRESARALQSQGIMAEVATANSRDLQVAIDKATLAARRMLAQSIENKLMALEKRMITDIDAGESGEFYDTYRRATKSVASQVLRGSMIVESPYEKTKEGQYQAFVLVKIDLNTINEYLKSQINSSEILKAKFEEKKLMEELEKEVKKLEESRE